MAMDMFLELKGIEGEAQDKTHKDKIDILAWSWGASQSGTTHSGSGSGSGKVSIQDLSLTKYIDKSSPTLLLHACNGKHIATGTLIIRKAGDTPLEYIKIELKEIIVTHDSLGGSGGEDRLTENVTLNFREFKYVYATQEKTGGKGKAPEAAWNIAENAPA